MMRRNEMKWFGRSLALAGALVLAGAGVMAAEYVIDETKATDPGNEVYKTLEEFSAAKGGYNQLQDGDTLTFANGDDSLLGKLTQPALSAGATPTGLTLRAAEGKEKVILTPAGGHVAYLGGFLTYTNIVDFTEHAALTLDGVELKGWSVTGSNARGGALYSPNLTLSAGARGAFFTDNTATGADVAGTGLGGAVYAYDSLTFTDGAFTFAGNTANAGTGLNYSGLGGAIHSNGAVTVKAGTYVFTNNKADATGNVSTEGLARGGAMYVQYTAEFQDGDFTFDGNQALAGSGTLSGHGGAIFANTMKFRDGTYAFTNNIAQSGAGGSSGRGGALYGNAITFDKGSYTYSGNKALTGTGTFGGLGGAIFSSDLKILGGEHAFIGNHADNTGGAIRGDGWMPVTLIANDGDLLFQGNTQGTGTYLRANSVCTSSAALSFAAKTGQQIKFQDPVMTSAQVDINKPGADNPGTSMTEYAGTVWFDGSYWKDKGSVNPNDFTSEVSGTTTVHNGTMKLTGGVTYGLDNTSGSYTLGASATLFADATGNKIRTQHLTLEDRASLTFDMAGAVARDETGATTNLTMDFSGGFAGGSTLQVHAINVGASNGTFVLLDAKGALLGAIAVTSTINGQAATSPVAVGANARYGESSLSKTAEQILLVTSDADDSRAATWTGAASGVWNLTGNNWNLSDDSTLNVFKAGDHALFDATAPAEKRTVSLADDMLISGMSVSSSYTFQSDGAAARTLTARAAAASGTLITPTGGLFINPGASARFLVDLDIEKILTVYDGATMRLGAGRSVVTGAAGVVTLKNGSTFVFEAADDNGAITTGTLSAKTVTVESGAKLVGELDIDKLFAGDFTGAVITASDTLSVADGALLADETAFYKYAFAVNAADAKVLDLSFAPKGDGPTPPASFSGLAAGTNARGLAGALDAAWAAGATLPDGTLKTALNKLIAASPAEAAKRLAELSPAVLAGGADLAPLAAGRFQQGLDALWRWRQVHDAPDASTWSAASGMDSADAWARPAFDADRGWRFWASGSGAWSEYDSPNADPGYDAQEWAATVAGYKTFGPCREWSLGLAFNTNHSRLDWDGSRSKTTGDAIAGALLAGFERGGWFVNADAVWGTTEVESRRHLPLAGLTARADYRTHWYGADLTAGRRWQTGGWTLAPAAGARWYRYDTPGVAEKGAGAAGLVMGKHHQTSVELFARLDVSRAWTLANGVSLRPHGFAGVAVETADRAASPTMGFVGTPAIPAFRGRSPEAGRTAAQFGLGLETKFAERWTVDVEYAGEFRDRAQRHGGRVGIGLAF